MNRTPLHHFSHFASAGLTGPATAASVFGRFEATHGNELWTGDALRGPKITGRKTYLHACIDDHSPSRKARAPTISSAETSTGSGSSSQ